MTIVEKQKLAEEFIKVVGNLSEAFGISHKCFIAIKLNIEIKEGK